MDDDDSEQSVGATDDTESQAATAFVNLDDGLHAGNDGQRGRVCGGQNVQKR